MGTVTRMHSSLDEVCVHARRIAAERGFTRAVGDYAAAAARAHITGIPCDDFPPYALSAVVVMRRLHREHPATYWARVHRNTIAAVALDAIAAHEASRR